MKGERGMQPDIVEAAGEPALPDDARPAAQAALVAHGLSQAAAAAKIGISPAALNQWLKGVYAGDNEAVGGKVRRWLDSLGPRASAQAVRIEEPGWQPTPTGERILSLLHMAQHAPDIVVIAGVPGTGKTVAARHYCATNPNAWLCTMDVQTGRPAGMLAEIMGAVGVPAGNPTEARARIAERLRRTDGLLVIDESQYLSRHALDLARSLHDRIGIGIALIGNHGLYAGTVAARASDSFAQFFSRVGGRMRIDAPSARDVDVMLDAWRIAGAEERKFLRSVATKLWALRGLKKTLHAAAAIAAADGTAVGLPQLKAAWASLNLFEDRA